MTTKTYDTFDVITDSRGVTTITMDVPGRPMNVFSTEAMADLHAIVDDLERSTETKFVVFRSGKESGFLAGADISGFADVEALDQADQMIAAGQKLFARIEKLSMPTIAVIHGPCLGGGLELSLACNYRIARDDETTKIGLPEIMLGFIPGWGGTQRLPRRVGLRTSLDMILKGKHLATSKALKVGLIDRAIDPQQWESGIAEFIDEVVSGKVRASGRKTTLGDRFLDGTKLGRALVFRTAEKTISPQIKMYPALSSAVKAIRASYSGGTDGYDRERSEFVKLLSTPTCHSLVQLFLSREKARNLRTWAGDHADAASENPISKIGVIGAGAMGGGIGQLAAVKGYDVVLKEINAEAAAAGRNQIDKMVEKLAARKKWSDAETKQVLDRIELTIDDQKLNDVDLVVEAAIENEDIKQSIFETLDRVAKPGATLATNTSSLSVARMASATKRPDAVAGLHFFNPVARMELVEVVKAEHTSDATIARLVAFVKALGKTPIVTADAPGFLVNRVLFPYMGEAVLMFSEGYGVEAIDKEIRQFGMPMGPLELLDQVGLDVAHHISSSLQGVIAGVEPVVNELATLVNAGHFGKKTQQGFYHYKNGKRGDVAVPTRTVPSDNHHEFSDDGLTHIQRRLIYPILVEAIRAQAEGIVSQAWAIDLAMVLGTGFAPHRGGPLHVADAIGLETLLTNLRKLESVYGNRFAPPQRLIDMTVQNETFFSGVIVSAEKSIAN